MARWHRAPPTLVLPSRSSFPGNGRPAVRRRKTSQASPKSIGKNIRPQNVPRNTGPNERIAGEDFRGGQDAPAGVSLLAGSDPPTRDVFPGFSLHDELGLLVRAGLTPLEAIQAATLNAAKCLGLSDSYGTVEKGKTADLLLLDADPLAAIGNTKKIAAVIVAGKFLPKAALQEMLERTEGR